MNINVKVPAHVMIRAVYLFFIIAAVQTGVGIMGAPRYIFEFTGHDSWVSVIIAHGFIMLTVAVMFIILNQYENADIFGIQVDVFGQFFGKLLGVVYIVYFGLALVSVLKTYTEAVKMFLYPTFPAYLIGIFIFLLVIYAIFGGVRVITGVAFLFFLFSQLILLLLYDPITKLEWGHFLPVLDTPLTELLEGARATTYTLSGYEILFLLYPFIENKEKSKLPAFLGITYTSVILLSVTVILTGYFSLEFIEDIEWSLLTLFKSITFPFIERIDYIVIMEWLMIVLPNNIFLLWGMTYGLKRLFNMKQKYSIFVLAIIMLVPITLINYDYQILNLTDIVAKAGFWIGFVYPFILLPCVLIRKRIRKAKGANES